MSNPEQSSILRDGNDKNRRNNIIIIILSVLLVGIVVVFFVQRNENKKIVRALNVEKESIQTDLNEIMANYDSLQTSNDTLQNELIIAQTKVKNFLLEVQQVKKASYQQISQYREEVNTLRGIMRNYIIQIDSLNQRNKELLAENIEVKQNIAMVESKNQQLESDKEKLEEKVRKAAQLEAIELSATGINQRGKDVESVRRAVQIKVSFELSRNVTAPRGDKNIYIRIRKPNQVLLQKSPDDLFKFEDLVIPYTAKREVFYEGNQLPVNIYWDNTGEPELINGEYTVDVFADGNNIGTATFKLER